MGFLSGLGKVLKGQPVFEPTAQPPGTGETPTTQTTETPTETRAVPVVMIGRIECPVNDQHMDVYGDVHNGSSEPVYLDKIQVLGTVHELDTRLKPGEVRQFLLYRGGVLASPPSGYAELQYRTEDGRYFAARHRIEVHQEPFGYVIHELELQMPIHDIH